MTNACFSKDGSEYKIEINGHAGDKLVCSACSAFACLLINKLYNECTAGQIYDYDYSVDYESGNVCAVFKCRQNNQYRIKIMLEMIINGFQMLENEYPENVRVSNDCI